MLQFAAVLWSLWIWPFVILLTSKCLDSSGHFSVSEAAVEKEGDGGQKMMLSGTLSGNSLKLK